MTDPLRNVGVGLAVTPRVLTRLRRTAEREVPRPHVLDVLQVLRWVVNLSAVASFVVLFNVTTGRFDSGEWSGQLAWGVFLVGAFVPIAVLTTILNGIEEPHARRYAETVQTRMAVLARERQASIDEREQFYASSEWRALRRSVIADEGRRCSICSVTVPSGADLTVDHIKPRSRFPELALTRSNLQILCRSCNSRKGNR